MSANVAAKPEATPDVLSGAAHTPEPKGIAENRPAKPEEKAEEEKTGPEPSGEIMPEPMPAQEVKSIAAFVPFAEPRMGIHA